MKPYILVIGSSNTDMVAKADHLPAPGETILGNTFIMAAGGKGANQAVAAARLGANVAFIAKLGADIFGAQTIKSFKEEGIDTSLIATDPINPSGVALITVDSKGENCIVVASGANANLLPDDLSKAEAKIKNASLILMQLEIPLATVEHVAERAAVYGVPFILNPAPAQPIPPHLYRKIAIITPNQKETEMLTGIPVVDKASATRAAQALAATGIKTVIITLGAAGAMLIQNDTSHYISSPTVTAVDTTAAGDVFCGALSVALSENKPMKAAVAFACSAAALSVTRLGAQTSAPTRAELEGFLAG